MSREALKYYGRIARRRADTPLTPNEHRVLQHLATRHSALKVLNPAMSDIGNQIGIAKPHVHRAIAGLEAKGLLVVERTRGRRTSNVYRFPQGWDEDGSGEQFFASIKLLCRAKKAAKTDAPDAIHSYQSGNSKTALAEPETDPPNGFHSYQSGNPHSYQSGNAFKQDKRPAPIYAAKRGRIRPKNNDGIKPQNAGGNLRATKAPKGAEK